VQEVVDHYELAYLVRTRMHSATSRSTTTPWSARATATILDQWSMLQTVVGVGKSQYNGEVPINTTLVDGKYKMKDDTRGTGGTFGAMAITNANHGTSAGSVHVNDTNTWGDGKQYVAAAAPPTPTARPRR
jgi:hypothetical protein